MISVCYTGPFLDSSGYGEATRNAIMALREAGADIKTQKVSFTGKNIYKTRAAVIAEELSTRDVNYRIKIIHTTPDIYKGYIEKSKYNIGHLFWETNRLPNSWVDACNNMNEIWTGTELNAETIKNSGVNVPVYVFPQSIDTSESLTDVRKFVLPNFNGVLFYSIFDWNERKDPKTLIHAFWKEFKGEKDVALLIKTQKSSYSDEGNTMIVDEIKKWKNALGWKDTPRLFLCNLNLSEEEKHRLHKTGDIYVSSHRGEGWAIPIAEATLHKNPVISVKYGGICEYFTARHFYEVEHELVKVGKVLNRYYEPDMLWAQASEEDLRALMRKVYDQLTSEKQKSLPRIRSSQANKILTTKFDYKTVGDAMYRRLEEINLTL